MFLKYFIFFNLIYFSFMSLFFFDLFIMWFFLEIINFLFIYLMNLTMNNKKIIFLYFIIQILSSLLMIYSITMQNMIMLKTNFSFYIILISLLIKLTIPPFHTWLPIITRHLPWNTLFILITIQKITPFYMMSLINFNFLFLYPILIMSSIIPPFMCLNLTNFKLIMAYSSINQSSWMLLLIYFKNIIWFKYFLFYSITMLPIIFMFNYSKILSMNPNIFSNKLTQFNIMILIMMMNLAGLPPFSMFLLKWYTIFIIIKLNNFMMILIIMMFSSLFMLFIYSNMIINSLYFYKLESKMMKPSPLIPFPLKLYSSLFLMFMSLLIFMI